MSATEKSTYLETLSDIKAALCGIEMALNHIYVVLEDQARRPQRVIVEPSHDLTLESR
jgi:hypothetical protein